MLIFFSSLQVLFATGDVMAQQAVEKRGIKKHDLARTGRMALYGGGKHS
jgi:protein Mpv17